MPSNASKTRTCRVDDSPSTNNQTVDHCLVLVFFCLFETSSFFLHLVMNSQIINHRKYLRRNGIKHRQIIKCIFDSKERENKTSLFELFFFRFQSAINGYSDFVAAAPFSSINNHGTNRNVQKEFLIVTHSSLPVVVGLTLANKISVFSCSYKEKR